MSRSALLADSALTKGAPDDRASMQALVVVVGESRHALRLGDVVEVTPAAALLPPSVAGTLLIGYLDLRGEVLAVLGARQFLDLPARPLVPGDAFIVVQATGGRAAIVVDRIEGVEEVDLVQDSRTDRHDGSILARRAKAADGESLVAFIDLERLLTRERIGLNGAGAP